LSGREQIVPTLLEIQRAMHRSLVARDDSGATDHVASDGLMPGARLEIYRNTFVGTLTTALRLSYPSVHRLVGAAFFEGAAALYVEDEPPRSADLNEYGETFPGFLEHFAPAASLPYLPEVARLDWAVNRALHAADLEPLAVAELAKLNAADQNAIAFVPHPSISLLRARYPVDAIWRAVLEQDDAAMAAIDLAAGPVCLLVGRNEDGVAVTRCSEPAWEFASALFSSLPLQRAIRSAPEIDASVLLADHLSAGRLIDFTIGMGEAES